MLYGDSMEHFEMVVNMHYPALNPIQLGWDNVKSGGSYGPAVREYWLLHYVVSGCGVFKTENNTYKIKSGEIFVIPPFAETYYEADKTDPWEYIWVGFTTDMSLPEEVLTPVIKCNGAGKIFDMMRDSRNMLDGKSAYLSGCLWQLFSLILENKNQEYKADYIEKAISYMNTEYIKNIKISDISEMLNIDRCYFSYVFKKQLGVSPMKYLTELRLTKAAELITVYDKSPSTAAASVGYTDIYHFSKAFKKRFGASPRNYKKQIKK